MARRSRRPTLARAGRLYRYYVSQTVLKHGAGSCPVGRVPAGEIEAAVIDQLRAVFRQPEIVAGTWKAARAHADDITEADARAALQQLDPLWDELFPAEQARIVALLVERVDIGTDRLERPAAHGRARTASRARCWPEHREQPHDPRDADPRDRDAPRAVPHREARRAQGDAAARRRRAAAAGPTTRWSRRWPAPSAGSGCSKSGEFATIAELAEREGIAPSYMTRVLRLTLLAPDIVEAVLDGRQGHAMTLARLMEPFPLSWSEQKNTFVGT